MRHADMLLGEYLRLHPDGHHADEAVAAVATRLNAVMDNLQAYPRVLEEFNPAARCDELRAGLDSLSAATKGAQSRRHAEAAAAIDRVARLCPPRP